MARYSPETAERLRDENVKIEQEAKIRARWYDILCKGFAKSRSATPDFSADNFIRAPHFVGDEKLIQATIGEDLKDYGLVLTPKQIATHDGMETRIFVAKPGQVETYFKK